MIVLRMLNEAPLWLVTFEVVAVLVLYAVAAVYISRRIWGHEKLTLNNEVGGFKYSVCGVLYAVVLGFVVIAVWENYEDTAGAVRAETKGIRDLMQISYSLEEKRGDIMRALLTGYANSVRKSEWPAMADGGRSEDTAERLAHLEWAVFNFKTDNRQDLARYQEALRLVAVVEDSRSERLDSANGSVPGLIWLILVVGAFIVLGFPAFFGSPNASAQLCMAAATALLVALVLLPALLLDYPFTGPIAISAKPFLEAVNETPPHFREVVH